MGVSTLRRTDVYQDLGGSNPFVGYGRQLENLRQSDRVHLGAIETCFKDWAKTFEELALPLEEKLPWSSIDLDIEPGKLEKELERALVKVNLK